MECDGIIAGSQHSLDWKGPYSLPSRCHGQDTFHSPSAHSSIHDLGCCGDGTSQCSDSLCQQLMVKNLFLMSNLNPPT